MLGVRAGMCARRIACGSVYRRLQFLWTVLPERPPNLVQPHVDMELLQDVSAADRACTDVGHGAWHLRRRDGRVKDARRRSSGLHGAALGDGPVLDSTGNRHKLGKAVDFNADRSRSEARPLTLLMLRPRGQGRGYGRGWGRPHRHVMLRAARVRAVRVRAALSLALWVKLAHR
jgi:hypothetical protein